MKNVIKLSIVQVLLFFFSSCRSPHIDEKYAAAVVKEKLLLSGSVFAQKFESGFSGTMNFLVADGQKKYVIKLAKKRSLCEQEIYNFNIASREGYGPQIYFIDPLHKFMIMEYLSSKKISHQDLQSDQLYISLAHFLQKMHQGKAFVNSGVDIFKKINRDIIINKSKCGDDIPLTKVEQIITVIHQALLPHLVTTVPCHNDLHSGNLAFIGPDVKAFDYGNAGPGDPFFDIAMVLVSFPSTAAHEKILFTTYLGRQPSKEEEAKLYLMQQLVLIKWIFDALDRLSLENIHLYHLSKAASFPDIARKHLEGKIDWGKPDNNLVLLKTLLNKVFDNFESQCFHNAVKLLKH